jgi:hypothetical protein
VNTGAGHWLEDHACGLISWLQGHVNIFEDGSAGDASHAIGGLDKVVAGVTGLLAAECIGENKRFGKLKGAHQEASAVDGGCGFEIHCDLHLRLKVSVSKKFWVRVE